MESGRIEDVGAQRTLTPNNAPVEQSPAGFWIHGVSGRRPFLTVGALARALLAIGFTLLVGWILWRGRGTLAPFLIGGLLALMLAPLIQLLERWMPRRTAIIVIYLVATASLGGGFVWGGQWLATQVQSLLEAIPSVMQVEEWFSGLLMQGQNYLPSAWRDPLTDAAQGAITTLQANTVEYLQSIGAYLLNQTLNLVQLFALLTGFIVLPFWIFFVLDSSPQLRTMLDKSLHHGVRADFWAIWSLFTRVVGAYVRGTVILGLIVGVLVAAGMYGLRLFGFEVPNIFLLAVFSGFGEFIPFIGPVISSVPAIILMLSGSFEAGLAMLVVYIVVQQLENNLLVPYVMGEAIRIHPAIMTVALFAAGGAFGFVGVLLVTPVTAFGRDLFVYSYSRLQGHTSERAYAITRPPEEPTAPKTEQSQSAYNNPNPTEN